MQQTWHDLLFMHWPISASLIRPIVPSELELDTFDGEAWIAVVPFWMSGIRQRGFPAIPGLSRFPELNVRTYVRVQDKPGVYFFSLDAASSIANTTGVAFNIDNAQPNLTYNGTINQTSAASAVKINAMSGGSTATFGGKITASTGAANAIDLTNNLLANKEPTRTRTYTLAPVLFLAMGIGAIATDIFLRR